MHAILDDCKANETSSSSKETGDGSADVMEEEQSGANQETHFAIKVYKTTLAGFRNRAEYVRDDFRFKNPRRVMKIWAEKEFLNMKRLTGFLVGINKCLKHHCLI